MPIGAPKELSELRRFFLELRLPKLANRGLRAYLVEAVSPRVARAFGYSLNSFHVLVIIFAEKPTRLFSSRGTALDPTQEVGGRDLIVSCASRTIRFMR